MVSEVDKAETPQILNAMKDFFTNLVNSDSTEDEIDFNSIMQNSDTEYLQEFLSIIINSEKQEELKRQQKATEKRINNVLNEIYHSELKEVTLSQDFKTKKELAKHLLGFEGKKKLTREEQEQLDNKIIELNALNYGKALKSGEIVLTKGSPLNSDLIKTMSDLGFSPNAENMGLFQVLKDFDAKSQSEIFEIIKTKKLTSPKDVMDAIKSWHTNKVKEYEKQVREIAVECLFNPMKQACAAIDSHLDNLSIMDSEWWSENLGGLIEKVMGSNEQAVTLSNYKKIIKRELDKSREELKSLVNNPEAFKKKFKSLSGVEYDEKKIVTYIETAQTNKKSDKEFEAAFGKEGTEFVEFVQKQINKKVNFNTAANIAQMIIGMKTIGHFLSAGVQKLTSVSSTAQKVMAIAHTATKTGKITNLAIGTTLGSANMATWNTTHALASISTKLLDGRKVTSEDWAKVQKEAVSGAAFGAFASLFNATVVPKVENVILKVFEKSEFTGAELMSKMLGKTPEFKEALKGGKDGVLKYLKAEYPEAIAGSVGFVTEIAGFTGYEVGIKVWKSDLNQEKMKKSLLMAGVSEEEVNALSDEELVFAYLGKTFEEQGKTLLSFKGVGKLLQWRMGGRIAQGMMNEQLSKLVNGSELLKDMKIKPVKENGHTVYKITDKSGKTQILKSREDVIRAAMQMAYFETLVNPDVLPKLNVAGKADMNKDLPLEERLNSAASREEFVAIRDEIKAMPESAEKTKLREAYVQKYRNWSSSSNRPDIRMEYRPEKAEQAKKYVESIDELLVDEHISNTEANAILRKYGLSEQDIASLRNEIGENFNALIEAVDIIIKYGKNEDLEDITPQMLKTSLKEASEENCFLDAIKLFNNKTLDSVTEKLGIKSKEEAIVFLRALLNSENVKQMANKNLVLIQQIAEITEKSFPDIIDELDDLRYINSIAELTPEKIKAQKQISDALGVEVDLKEASYIKNLEQVTPEFVQEFKIQIERLNKLGIKTTYHIDPVELSERLKSVLKHTDEELKSIMPENRGLINAENLYFSGRLWFDKDFPKDQIANIMRGTRAGNISLAERLCFDKDFPKDKIARIISGACAENITLAERLCFDKEFPKDEIADIIVYTRADNIFLAERLCFDKDFPKDLIANIISRTCPEKISLTERLCFDKEFPKSLIANIISHTRAENISLAECLCFDKDFPKDQIVNIIGSTSAENISLAERLCYDKDFPKDKIANTIKHYNGDSKPLADLIIQTEGLNLSVLSSVMDNIICKDGVNKGEIDTNKVKRYTALLEDPKTKQFMVNKLNSGLDIDTAAFLLKTQKKLNSEKAPAQEKKTQEYSDGLKDSQKIFEELGLNENETKAVLKAISENDVVDEAMQNQAISLIKRGLPKNKIGEILSASKITGEFNPEIINSYISIQGIGLNPLLEKNLSIINNISGAETAEKFNPKIRKQIKAMVEHLPDGMKTVLENKGFNLASIIEKLETQQIKLKQAAPQKVKLPEGMRVSKSKLGDFERIVVDKYNPVDNIWQNEAACKSWAEDKYNDMKNGDYESRTYPAANEGRKKILGEWFEFLDKDPDVQNNPFVKIIVTEFITKELAPENAWLPPEFDKEIAKEVLNAAIENHSTSISSAYTKRIRAKAEKSTIQEEVFVDGIKGKWYTVPQTDKSSSDFKANADKIKAFSDGTNWCIRTYNAEPYTQQGAMHFFVDENGLTQVCVRENAPGKVAEIQKRQQNATRPIPYITVVKDFLDRHELKTSQGYLDDALNAKPKFDAQKKEFNQLASVGDYKSILEKMGIKVETLPDGTFAISHYTPTLGEYTINDLGIKENDLLSNVSVIKGGATFENSNATALPNLREVQGKFTFDGSQISDIRNLKEINGYKIEWE